MKWIAIAVGIIVALIVLIVVIGSILPRDHVATISARISARRSRGRSEASSGFRLWLGLRFGMVVPLVTGGSGNDDYQRACGRRETALHGTDSYGLLPPGSRPGYRCRLGPTGIS